MNTMEMQRQTIPSTLVPRDFLFDDRRAAARRQKINRIIAEARRYIPGALTPETGLHEDIAMHQEICGTVILPIFNGPRISPRGRNRTDRKAA